jgi:hypothetical protein
MKFSMEIGESEKHKLDFSFNQLLGLMVIKVDNKEITKRLRLIGEPMFEAHALTLGDKGELSVRIEKERKLPFGQKCRVFVNDRLLRCYHGL